MSAFLAFALLGAAFPAPEQQPSDAKPLPPPIPDELGNRIELMGDLDGDHCQDFALDDGSGWICVVSGKTGKRITSVPGGEQERAHEVIAALHADVDGDHVWDLGELTRGADSTPHLWLRSGKDLHPIRELPLPSGTGSVTDAAIADAGDWNGDGVQDLATCVLRDGIRRAWVVSGKDGQVICECPRPDVHSDSTQSGEWEATITSSPRAGHADRSLATVLGSAHVVLHRMEAMARPTVLPLGSPEPEARRSLAFVGDHDGDGVPDVVIAYVPVPTSFDKPGETKPGHSMLMSGASGEPIAEIALGQGAALDGVSGTQLSDLDGDGIPEYLVCYSGFLMGHSLIYSGKTNVVLRSILESEACCAESCRFGASCANLGDVDGDNVGDYAIGSNGGYDRAFPGCVSAFSGKTGKKLYSVWKSDLLKAQR